MTPDKFAPIHSPIVPTHMDGRMTPDKLASNVDSKCLVLKFVLYSGLISRNYSAIIEYKNNQTFDKGR